MQKNLKSKVLLTLLAASVFYLPAYANAANLTVDGNKTTEGTLKDWQHKIIESDYSSVNAIYHAPTEEGNQLTITGTPKFISQQDNYYHTLYGAYEEVNTEGQGAAANGNTVTLNGTDFANADPEIAGAYVNLFADGNATLNNNAVNISSGSFADDTYISGAYAYSNSSGTFTLQNNRVTIDGTAFNFTANEADVAYIRGAYADASYGSNFNLTGNKVEIKNAEFKNNTTKDATAYIYGADAYIREENNNATFEQNQVLISGGEFAGTALIAGASAASQDTWPTETTATFSKNEVLISGGEFTGDTYIFGVLNDSAQLDATIQDNTVTITGAAGGEVHDLSKAAFYGFGFDEEYPDDNDMYANWVINGTKELTGEYISGDDFLKMYSITAANNNLEIDNWSGTIKSAKLFDNINFVNTEWNPGGTVLTIAGAAENDLAKTKIDIVSFASGAEFTPGDSMTFIKGNVDLGIAEKQNNAAETAEYINANAGVAQVVNGTTTITEDGTAFKFTVDSVGLAQQTYLVAETRAASAAFVNQGTDLINDSLDVLGRDGTYGVKTFAAVQGNRSSYDVADDLKINGWSVIAGFGAENEHKGGDFAWGVFYENGSGNYRTYNTFNNEFFRGDGSMVYNGGGIAARYENAKGVYTEGSLRAGMLKTEMDNALRDSSGASYGYDSESTYYGAHVGVGQIFELSENTDLDVYGKFFHTYVEGDSFTVGSDKFDFDSVTSDRLRVGARVTKQQAKVNTYYGLAYEYEFNGDADMTAQGIRAERQSFGGGSGIAELGFNYQPGTDSPWNFDLNLRGYVGERQGGSFNVQATYTF